MDERAGRLKEIVCYEKRQIERLTKLINGLRAPIFENLESMVEIKKILESGKIGTMKEEGENAMEQQEVCKN